jgi:hypothetical protein
MATREMESLETRCVESLLVVYLLCVFAFSRLQKTNFLCPNGASDQVAPPHYNKLGNGRSHRLQRESQNLTQCYGGREDDSIQLF